VREDDFSPATKRLLAARVGYACSCPECRAPTSGPQLEPDKSVSAGDAAHITAASPNGPRYDPSLTPEERRHHNNGIWLCVIHARIVDQDKTRYTVEALRRWKTDAEAEAQRKLGRPHISPDGVQIGNCESLPSGHRVLTDFLASYRKLITQSRGYILSQVIHLKGLTDLAAWRRAQANGALRQFKALCDAQKALWTNPETMAVVGSVGTVAQYLKNLTLEATKEDVRQRAAWESWSELTLQLGNRGPHCDAQVQAWQQASLAFLDTSLTALATKERLIADAVQKWLADNAESVGGETFDGGKGIGDR
jgi:hypothetical protein